MPVTFIKSSNAATSGTAIGNSGQDIWIKKLIVGNPVNSGNIGIYNSVNPLPSFNSANDTQLLFKNTYEASVGSSTQRIFDFTTQGDQSQQGSTPASGLQVDGGNVMIDQNMQVTVIWDYAGSNVL